MTLQKTKPAPFVDGHGFLEADRLGSAITQEHKSPLAPKQVVLTAIPRDRDQWAMKAIYDQETVRLPGIFHSRLEALGACVLLAEKCGGEVRA